MKIVLYRKEFLNIAVILSVADDGKRGALFTAGSNLSLMASDGEMFLTASMAAKVERPGAAVLDLKKIIAIAHAVEGETMLIDVTPVGGTLLAGKSKYRIMARPEAEYPTMVPPEGGQAAVFKASIFAEVVSKVLPSIDEKGMRLQGCYMKFDGPNVIFAGTDGRQLAELTRPIQQSGEGAGVVPVRALRAAATIACQMEADSTIDFSLAGSALLLSGGGFQLTALLLEQEFPQYERIFPKPEAMEATARVKAGVLYATLARAALATQNSSGSVVMGTEECLGFRLGAKDNPDFTETVVSAMMTGKNLEVSYSLRQLSGAIATIPADAEVDLIINGETSPLRIGYAGDPGWRYVAMPMRG